MNVDVLRLILMDAPGDPLCESCLTAVCGLPSEQVRAAIASLLNANGEFDRRWSA